MKEKINRKDELINRLFKVAKEQASKNSLSFDDNLESELINFITLAINNLTDSQLKDEKSILLAEENLIVLIDLMSRNVHKRNLDDVSESFGHGLQRFIRTSESLDISAFKFALRGFCPRFPFC